MILPSKTANISDHRFSSYNFSTLRIAVKARYSLYHLYHCCTCTIIVDGEIVAHAHKVLEKESGDSSVNTVGKVCRYVIGS